MRRMSSSGPPIPPPRRGFRLVRGELEDPTPMSAPAMPDRMTITRISILPTPSTLMIRSPSLWYRAWMKQRRVITPTAMVRTFHLLTSISRAYMTYSPSTMQFGVLKPRSTT